MRKITRSGFLGLVVGALVMVGCGQPPPPPPTGSFALVHPMSDLVRVDASARAMSADGRYAALRVTDMSQTNIRVWDRETGDVTMVNPPGYFIDIPAVSGDGSVVIFTQGSGEVAPGLVATGDEFFLYSTGTGAIERIEVPRHGSSLNISSLSISHDGSTVVLNNGTRTDVWTRDGGFEPLVADPTVTGRVEPASLSPNGRFVTLRHVVPLEPPGRIRSDYVVYDRELGTVHATSQGPTWTPDILNPTGFHFDLVATTDDGSALYSYSETSGVFVLDGTTGVTSMLPGAGGRTVTGASRNGRFVSYRSAPQYFPPIAPVHRMLDRVTGTVTQVGWAQTPNAGIWAASDDGRHLLLHSWEVGIVPASGYYLWDREG